MNNCPRCNSLLERKISGKIKYEHCSSCDGILIYEDQIRKIVRSNKQGNEIRKSNKTPIKDTISVKCPACTGKFIQIKFNSIAIDKCIDCNLIWLDGGELEKYVKYLQSIDPSSGKNIFEDMTDYTFAEILSSLVEGCIGAIFDGI